MLLRRRVTALAAAAATATAVVLHLALAPEAGAAPRAAASSWHPLVGHVSADTPVRGARVAIFDWQGRLIARAPRPTDVNGAFYLRMPRVPGAFIVRTSGGRDDSGFVLGGLESRVAHHRLYRPVVVNTATTLEATYAAVRPRLSHAVAERRVARFLGLPTGMDVRVDLLLNDTEFHGGAFMATARRNPRALSRRLVGAIDAGRRMHYAPRPTRNTGTTRTPGSAKVSGVPMTNAQFIQATSGIVSLVTGSAAGGSIFGAVLGSVLGHDPDPQAQQFAQIDAKLDALQSELNFSLGLQYTAQVHEDYDAYTSSVQQFDHLGSRMHEAWVAYSIAVRASAAPSRSPKWLIMPHPTLPDAATARANFAGYYSDETLADGLSYLADRMTASGASGGSPLALWKRVLDDRNRFVDSEGQDEYAAAYQYWRVLHARLLIMNVEYASTDAGARYRGRIQQWVGSYARRGSDGSTEGPELRDWYAQTGLGTVTRRMEQGELYDIGTGLHWTAQPIPGERLPGRWHALLAQERGSKWSFPTEAQAASLFSRAGSRPGMAERGLSDGAAYLRSAGWDGLATCSTFYVDNPNISDTTLLFDVASGAITRVAGTPDWKNVCVIGVWDAGAGVRPVPG